MNKNKTYLHVAVALILGLLIGFGVQPENGLTVLGVRVLAVTIPTLYLWLTVNTSWCALLFLALLILTGAMTPTEVWAGSMGHFAVITMIVFSILKLRAQGDRRHRPCGGMVHFAHTRSFTVAPPPTSKS